MGFNYSAVARDVASAQSGNKSLDLYLKMQQFQLQQDEQQRLVQQDMYKRQQQAKFDQIANGLLDVRQNTVNPPRAEAVEPQPDGSYAPSTDDDVNQSYKAYGVPSAPYTGSTGGEAELQMRNQLANNSLETQMKQAQIGQYLARTNKLNTQAAGGDGLTPGQRQHHSEWQTNQDRLNSTYGPSAPNPVLDSPEQLNKDFEARTGHKWSELASLKPGQQHLDSTGFWVGGYTPQDHPNFVSKLFGATDTSGTPVPKWTVPTSLYQQTLARQQAMDAGHPQVLNQAAIDAAKQSRPAPSASLGGALPADPSATAPAPTLLQGGAAAASGTADPQSQALAIKAQLRAGSMTRDQATTALQALGFD